MKSKWPGGNYKTLCNIYRMESWHINTPTSSPSLFSEIDKRMVSTKEGRLLVETNHCTYSLPSDKVVIVSWTEKEDED